MIHNKLHCFSTFNAPTTRTISSLSDLQFLKAWFNRRASFEDVLYLAIVDQLRKKRNTDTGVAVTRLVVW
jgi:hypothetical protein